MKVCLYAHWEAVRYEGSYYLNGTHAAYLEFLVETHQVDVLCFVTEGNIEPAHLQRIDDVAFFGLPSGSGYFKSYWNIASYIRFVKDHFLKFNYGLVYCRVPDPMSWLVSMCASHDKLVHHYVGDSIEATIKGRGSLLVRMAKIVLYLPEYGLTLLTSRFHADEVYCNGPHLTSKLKKYGIKSRTVISSTIREKDIDDIVVRHKAKHIIELLYVGHVRKAKGILTILDAFYKIFKERNDVRLTIVGTGDDMEAVTQYVKRNALQDCVRLLGHIDNRDELKKIYMEHDLFCFASVSEGSPRVVVEAMLSGLPVVSTRVGSLPHCFTDDVDIFFSEGLDSVCFYEALNRALKSNPEKLFRIAASGYHKSRSNYNLDKFLGEIFS